MATATLQPGTSLTNNPPISGANAGSSSAGAPALGIQSFYHSKIQSYELLINDKTQNLRRLEAQRNALNARVRLLREELQLLQEPGSYVGEVVKVMGKKKVLVKVQPEGKYGKYLLSDRLAELVEHILNHLNIDFEMARGSDQTDLPLPPCSPPPYSRRLRSRH